MTEPACPCEIFIHPRIISNLPGRASIDYRAGDYTAFRHALLRSRPGERALADWHPTAGDDLALQLLEWWAYLADVLTFYNERALHEALLRTAVLPEDIRRIVRLLGYRPRPGIGATGVVAALTDSPRPFVLAQGFPIQGSPGAGKPPQVFELDEESEVGLLGRPLPPSAGFPALPGSAQRLPQGSVLPGSTNTWMGYAARDSQGLLRNSVPAHEKPDSQLSVEVGQLCRLGIRGVVTLLKPQDTVLLLKRDWDGAPAKIDPTVPARRDHALAVVESLEPSWDEAGRAVTVVTLHPGERLDEGSLRQDYRILKATKLAHLWLYHERYPGPKLPSPGNLFGQLVKTFFDPAGLFGGGISAEPPEDAHVMTSWVMGAVRGAAGVAHLEAITRGISPGDPVLFEQKVLPGGLAQLFAAMTQNGLSHLIGDLVKQQEALREKTLLAKVTDYSEVIWYANPPEGDRIGQGPPIGPPSHGLISGGASPIPIPHSRIAFNDSGIASLMSGPNDENIGTIVVHYGWQEVGELVETPISTETTTTSTGPPVDEMTALRPIDVPGPPELPQEALLPVLIEDTTGAGAPGWIGVTNSDHPPLVSPLRALLNLLPVSRGQTVTDEIVGSGESILINQEFVLKQSPLTYLTDTGPRSMNGYRSTLHVRVDGIEWHEVPTFYGQPADARVFVTREDEKHSTHVRFGDGEFGARLPTGIDNVIATYRYGSGAEVPGVGSLTTILRPQQGLQAIRNPIAPSGGADPDPPEQIRRYASRSVLTFGRAISGDDYETIAAQTPGVRRARVRWIWDANLQRTLVKVFVGDDDAAVTAARAALRAFGDPNRPIVVEQAEPRYADITLTLEIDPDYVPAAVSAAVRASFLDPQQEPFGTEVVRIDDVVYNSQIYGICMQAPGVVAVHGLAFRTLGTVSGGRQRRRPTPGFGRVFEVWEPVAGGTLQLETGERHSPGEGRFYLLRGDGLHISTEVGRHGH